MNLRDFCKVFSGDAIHPRHIDKTTILLYEVCGYAGESADYVGDIYPLTDGDDFWFYEMGDKKVLYACPHSTKPGIIEVYVE